MSYGHSLDTHHVHSMAEVEQLTREIAAWRGKPDEFPMHTQRRGHDFTLLVHHDAYRLRLYKTNVVTYFKDGRVAICPFDSQMTVSAVRATAPTCVGAVMHRGAMYISLRFTDGSTRMFRQSVVFRLDGNYVDRASVQPLNLDRFHLGAWRVLKIDRAAADEIRKEFAEQIAAHKAILKLEEGPDREPVPRRTYPPGTTAIRHLEEAVHILSLAPDAGYQLAMRPFRWLGQKVVDINTVVNALAIERGRARWEYAPLDALPPEPTAMMKATAGTKFRALVRDTLENDEALMKATIHA